MLYLPLSKIIDSAEAVVAPGAVILAEGCALVRTNTAQSAGVLPATGTANDVFCGFSFAGTSAAPFPEGYTNKVECFVVPSTGIVTLAQTPVTGQVFIMDKTTNAPIPVSGGVSVTGAQVKGLTGGDTVEVTYKYQLSVVQARALYGDVQPGGYVGAYVGQIGLIKRGCIFTNQIDASVNWAAAKQIKLAANGQLTNEAGSGVAIQGYIVAIPSQANGFLGLEFSAA